jgi:signal transduction histidine kinase
MVLADLAVAVSTGFVTYRSQQGSLQDQLVTQARAGATILAAGAIPILSTSRGPGEHALLTSLVTDVVSNKDITYAAVFDPHGKALASTRQADISKGFSLPLGRLNGHQILGNGDVQAETPAVSNVGPIGFAVVTASSRTAREDLLRSTLASVAVRGLGLLVFLLLSLAIAQYLISPLENLARAARSIGRGELSTRLPEGGTTELATLAQTFNSMAESLEQRIKQLSFLAAAGSTLPNTFRNAGDVRPIVAQFCDELGASAAGLVPREDGDIEPLWYEDEHAGVGLERIASAIGRSARTADAFVRDQRSIMVVPVLGNAVFVTIRAQERPFSPEEQQVVINFAYELGIAADNARLFESQQEALAVKDQFLSIVSHELRTPLTTIKGYSQMLLRRLTGDETDGRYAANIDAQVTRLTRLVDDLLDVTRFARGQFELELAPMDLRPILQDIVSRFRIVAPRHSFQLDIEDDSFSGEWDHDRLEQVLNNLLSNAVKYSPDGGEVRVSAHREGDAAVITVQDQGIGIDEEHQRHLFERFYRAGGETGDIKGMGLGLYVARRIIEAHHGHISVSSTPGEGSDFSVTLPLVAQPAAVKS